MTRFLSVVRHWGILSVHDRPDDTGDASISQDEQAERLLARRISVGFHDPDGTSAEIHKLRQLHVEMDNAVAAAYGWTDLDLGFHETKQGVRYTISELARREVLARLLKLNDERYAEEVKQGLHTKRGGGGQSQGSGKKKAKSAVTGPTLFGDDDVEPEPAGSKQDSPESDTPNSLTRTKETPSRSADESTSRPAPIEEVETDQIMAAFRQAARGHAWLEREELLKDVSINLGYQRLGAKVDQALRGQLRAAIRRRIIEADGASLVRAATGTLADYTLEELRETFRSVMQKGYSYEREDVIRALARHLGFARVTDTSKEAIKSAINSAIRQGLLRYEGSVVWRDE